MSNIFNLRVDGDICDKIKNYNYDLNFHFRNYQIKILKECYDDYEGVFSINRLYETYCKKSREKKTI